MRIVNKEGEFLESLDSCKREALKSFKDENVILEKYITRPRHIEVQIFGDTHGNYVHLYERDCTVQRRHQKVIEESPSSLSKEELEYMYEKAIAAGSAVKYCNAGTVEFIYDMDTSKFYFMEMNTRLQVEHPVTEMITRQDLVEWQLRVAAGEKLPLSQENIPKIGHSFESRIYAEDPFNNFLPKIGKLHSIKTPFETDNVRIESGVRSGDEISVFYDPMIAKLITWGKDRNTALKNMRDALANYKIVGPENNIGFLKRICENDVFQNGKYDTGFIQRHGDNLLKKLKAIQNSDIIAAAIVAFEKENLYSQKAFNKELQNFRLNSTIHKIFKLSFHANFLENLEKEIKVELKTNGQVVVSFDKKSFSAKYEIVNSNLFVEIENEKFSKEIYLSKEISSIFTDDGDSLHIVFLLIKRNQDELFESAKDTSSSLDSNSIKAPMPGTIQKISVKAGDLVKAGDTLVILEAMKMEVMLIQQACDKVEFR